MLASCKGWVAEVRTGSSAIVAKNGKNRFLVIISNHFLLNSTYFGFLSKYFAWRILVKYCSKEKTGLEMKFWILIKKQVLHNAMKFFAKFIFKNNFKPTRFFHLQFCLNGMKYITISNGFIVSCISTQMTWIRLAGDCTVSRRRVETETKGNLCAELR